MKFVLVFLVAIFVGSQAGDSDSTFKCPQPYFSRLKPLILKNFLGVWFRIRGAHWEEHEADCISETLWRATETPSNALNAVWLSQTNGTWNYEQGAIKIKSTPVDGEVEALWQFTLENLTVNSVFVEHDNGQYWGITHSCIEDQNGNLTSLWGVLSRGRKMDAQLEQTLVEKIEKYSGLTQEKLHGIRQSGCYELDSKKRL